MNKLTKKYIILGIIIIFCILYINTCMMTNIPDELTIIHEDSITAYNSNYDYIKYDFIPGQALSIRFDRSIFWKYDNSDYLYIRGNLFAEEPHGILDIKEISYNYNGVNYKLIENEKFGISNYNISGHESINNFLVDEYNEPIAINDKVLHPVWISFGYNNSPNPITFNLKPKYLGQEKEIELIQIYSINYENYREEKYKYKVICGGRKFDIERPVKSLLKYTITR